MSINWPTRLFRSARRDLEQASIELKGLFGVQELVKVRLLGQVADPLVLGDVRRRFVEDQRLALGREQQAEQQLDRRGLPGAVGPEQAEDLAAMHLEVKCLERLNLGPAPEIAIDLGQIPRLDDDFRTHYASLPLEIQMSMNAESSSVCYERACRNVRPIPRGGPRQSAFRPKHCSAQHVRQG